MLRTRYASAGALLLGFLTLLAVAAFLDLAGGGKPAPDPVSVRLVHQQGILQSFSTSTRVAK